jgi:hypothetical protein
VLIAELIPAANRPYFGGSTDNNILELALGYNGLGRLSGSETGSIGGGGGGRGGTGFGGVTGLFRLFGAEFGGQVSWLIPAALLSLAALLWVSRRAARTSRVRAFALLWGGWLLVSGLVFSYMQGIIHPYYMVALAPAIGALVGVGAMSTTTWVRAATASAAGPARRRSPPGWPPTSSRRPSAASRSTTSPRRSSRYAPTWWADGTVAAAHQVPAPCRHHPPHRPYQPQLGIIVCRSDHIRPHTGTTCTR